MKKKTLLLILTVLSVLLVSCVVKNHKTISGTWVQHGADNIYTFYEDGSGIHDKGIQKNDISYETAGDIITIYDKTLWFFDSTEKYTFELDGDTLRMTDGVTTMVFSRQYED